MLLKIQIARGYSMLFTQDTTKDIWELVTDTEHQEALPQRVNQNVHFIKICTVFACALIKSLTKNTLDNFSTC